MRECRSLVGDLEGIRDCDLPTHTVLSNITPCLFPVLLNERDLYELGDCMCKLLAQRFGPFFNSSSVGKWDNQGKSEHQEGHTPQNNEAEW